MTRIGEWALTTVLLGLLGHSLGVGYLELKEKRSETLGMYVSALQPHEEYKTIDWDDFVYYPRAIALAENWWPIDPWVYHERRLQTWGVMPPAPATVFALILKAIGDIHVALYLATIASTVLIGLMMAFQLQQAPFHLSVPSALLAAVVFIKIPWLGVKAQQILPVGRFVRETVWPFLIGRPLDALTTVEAGLFTYTFYTLFIVLFWRAVYSQRRAAFLCAGAAAGFLIYVYFYHYIFAFALLASWLLIALLRREWLTVRLTAYALAAGFACTIPHFANMLRAAASLDVPAYVSRLGLEPGRFAFANLKYLAALAFPVAIAVGYMRRPPDSAVRPVALRVLTAMALAYLGVLNLRLILGFDLQSDHYWRQSFGLPATLWVIIVCTDISWGASKLPKLALVVVLAVGVIISNASWLTRRNHTERPSAGQREMAERMALVARVSKPGDVVMVIDVATTYHATVNARIRPYVPFVHALVSQDEIIRRFFVAQYLTGVEPLRMPGRTDLPNVDETAAMRSEQKYLMGTDDPQPMERVLEIKQEVSDAFERGDEVTAPRLDLILVPSAQQAVARARILRQFDIVREHSGAGYWAVSVRPKVSRA